MKFKGLQKLLAYEHFCYIKVSSSNCEQKLIQVVERTPIKEQAVMNETSNNILTGLTNLSQRLAFEMLDVDGKSENCEANFIDELVENGYSLHFYRLANFQVLSTICSGNAKEGYIPVKSVITRDIKAVFDTLNESLKQIPQDKFIFNFRNQIYEHEASVREYQKALQK